MKKITQEQLQNKIDVLKDKHVVGKKSNTPLRSSSIIFNVAVEMVAGLLVGLMLGFFLDEQFATKPLFLIICLFLGIGASFKVIWVKHISSSVRQNQLLRYKK